MSLSRKEQHWLPWFGGTGKLAMRWSCLLNRHRHDAMALTRQCRADFAAQPTDAAADHRDQLFANTVDNGTAAVARG